MSDDVIAYALVADDDALIRMDVAHILEDAGYRVHEAANVQEALSILNREGDSIQLLFSDVQMPPGDLDGFDLARHCATDWPRIAILVASGQAKPSPDDLPEGAVFIAKPFSANFVYERLQGILPDDDKPGPLKRLAR